MKKLEMVQHALSELGSVSPQEISDFIKKAHGIVIEPPIIAVMRATLWQEELLQQYRREAKDVIARARAS
jgi:hypothetical protein